MQSYSSSSEYSFILLTRLYVGSGDLSVCTKMNTNKLSLQQPEHNFTVSECAVAFINGALSLFSLLSVV